MLVLKVVVCVIDYVEVNFDWCMMLVEFVVFVLISVLYFKVLFCEMFGMFVY